MRLVSEEERVTLGEQRVRVGPDHVERAGGPRPRERRLKAACSLVLRRRERSVEARGHGDGRSAAVERIHAERVGDDVRAVAVHPEVVEVAEHRRGLRQHAVVHGAVRDAGERCERSNHQERIAALGDALVLVPVLAALADVVPVLEHGSGRRVDEDLPDRRRRLAREVDEPRERRREAVAALEQVHDELRRGRREPRVRVHESFLGEQLERRPDRALGVSRRRGRDVLGTHEVAAPHHEPALLVDAHGEAAVEHRRPRDPLFEVDVPHAAGARCDDEAEARRVEPRGRGQLVLQSRRRSLRFRLGRRSPTRPGCRGRRHARAAWSWDRARASSQGEPHASSSTRRDRRRGSPVDPSRDRRARRQGPEVRRASPNYGARTCPAPRSANRRPEQQIATST